MRTHVRKRIQRVGWILFFLVIWEVIAKTGMVSELILPPLEDIIGAFFGDLIHGTLLLRIGVSLAVVAAGTGHRDAYRSSPLDPRLYFPTACQRCGRH